MLKPFLSACCVVALFFSQALHAQQLELVKLPAGMMLRLQFDVYVNFAALSPDGSILATAAGTKLTAWDTRTGKALWNEILCAPVGPRCLAFSPDGKTLAACGDFSVLRFFDPLTGKQPILATSLPGRTDWWTLAFSPDGKHLVTAGVHNMLGFWDPKTGKQLHQPNYASNSIVMNVDFARGSNKLAVSSRGNSQIHFWDPHTAKEIGLVKGDGNPLEKALFAPDGNTLAYLHSDSSIILRDLAAGRDLRKIGGARNDGRLMESFAFSPDGRSLLVAQINDKVSYLLETATGRERARLIGQTERTYNLAFARHGRSAVTCSADKSVIVWDVTGLWRDGKYQTEKLSPEQLTTLFTSLETEPPDGAYRAIWKMALNPEQSVPFLRDIFLPHGPVKVPEPLATRIGELDDDDFLVREMAFAELKRLGAPAEKALRHALSGPLSAEAKARVQALLPPPLKLPAEPNRLFSTRLLETVELAGTSSARELMEDLARGHDEAWIREEARAALIRWRP